MDEKWIGFMLLVIGSMFVMAKAYIFDALEEKEAEHQVYVDERIGYYLYQVDVVEDTRCYGHPGVCAHCVNEFVCPWYIDGTCNYVDARI